MTRHERSGMGLEGGRPPRLAVRLLLRFAPSALAEPVEGDLREGYARRRQRGRLRAATWFWKEALLFSLWHGRYRPTTYHQAWGPIMWKSYLTVALRTMRRQAGYTAINVGGLAVGLACCLLIGLYVRNELAVNGAAVFPDGERIYRVDSDWREPSMGLAVTTLAPAAETMQRTYPEVEAATRLYLMTNHVRVDDTAVRRDVMMADPSFLTLFDLALLHGDPATALAQPRSVVLTARLAETLFGTTDVQGRTVHLQTWGAGEQAYTVTGVRPDLPFNSVTAFNTEHPEYDLLIGPEPFDFFPEEGWTSWHSRYIMQFVKLAPGVDVAALQAKLPAFVATHVPDLYQGDLNLTLNPLRTLYLTDQGNLGWRAVLVLVTIAGLLLVLASINFANLATARALMRAREVGVRKAVGAHRGQIARQFLGEAFLLTVLAAALGVGLAVWAQPLFFEAAGRPQVIAAPWDLATLGLVGGLVVLVSLLAGWYPALVLARFDPMRALKGRQRLSAGASGLRQGLVLVQFGVAIVLIVALYTIARQMNFVGSRDLGFEQEQVLVIDSLPRAFDAAGVERMQAVKTRLLAIPGVEAASLSWRTAAEGSGARRVYRPGQADADAVVTDYAVVDADFATTYGLTLKEGRFFDDARPGDANGVVLNETAARMLGLTGGIAGQQVIVRPDVPASDDAALPPPVPVLGVVEDFHFQSLHQTIQPLVFLSVRAETMYRVMALRLSAADVRGTVERVEVAWREALPGTPFAFTFLDDQVARMYQTEHRLRQIAGTAAGLAVGIACLGILGLAALSVAQRTKEIGIRKVLGATAAQIWLLLTRDVLRPVLGAVIVAVPIGYLLMQQWLEGFVYRIDLSGWALVLAGGTAVLLAGLAVSYQTIKAARTDPVRALRQE